MTVTCVYSVSGDYAGWPANHGAWQFGDELLVGFLRGPFKRRSLHNIGHPREKILARSLDGGISWAIEKPDVDFECSEEAVVSADPNIDLTRDIIRACGVYDHGGEACAVSGGFYVSSDRGHSWRGPYKQPHRNGMFGTSRTCVVSSLGLVLFSHSAELFQDEVSIYRANQDGVTYVSTLDTGGGRAVMPSAATINGDLYVALRRRRSDRCWIDVRCSSDGGLSFGPPSLVADTGGHNGNPPALLAIGESLICAFAHRDSGRIVLRVSHDRGLKWDREFTIAIGTCHDIGYPQLFLARGSVVCVYYWSQAGESQSIMATRVPVGEVMA